jgi:two-component system chemotaxis response regulator CheB
MVTRSKVLIVDDSALMRHLLAEIIDSDPDLEVVATACDSYDAREKIKKLDPDVLTLDIEMPRMDGLTFLEKLMRGHPMPVVMISSLTARSANIALRALSLGAIDYVTKPRLNASNGSIEQAEEIVTKVKSAAKARVRRGTASNTLSTPSLKRAHRPLGTNTIVAIGASTGGTEALKELLSPLPADFPGVLIVQHMPEAFTHKFANRLNSLCNMHVQEAQDGDRVLPGRALVAPGGHHMIVVRKKLDYIVRVYRGERVNRHLPSVDVLFSSFARDTGKNALGVLLTGMGTDGAKGMLEMKQAGAFTIAQDESTSVVFGMPREAILLHAVDQVLPLDQIPNALMQRLSSS